MPHRQHGRSGPSRGLVLEWRSERCIASDIQHRVTRLLQGRAREASAALLPHLQMACALHLADARAVQACVGRALALLWV